MVEDGLFCFYFFEYRTFCLRFCYACHTRRLGRSDDTRCTALSFILVWLRRRLENTITLFYELDFLLLRLTPNLFSTLRCSAQSLDV